MKIKLLLSVLLLLAAFAGVSFAQTVKIIPKKTVYRRVKPIDSGKQSFTITYPKVSGLAPTLNKKIESTLSYEHIFEFSLKDELTDEQWLWEASYQVNFNKRGILVVTLSIDGSGAYPSTSNRTLVVDLATGDRVTPDVVFSNPGGLAAMCKKAQRAEIKKALAAKVEESLFENSDFKTDDLKEFSVNDTGVTFIYDYGFPHVILAEQPDGRYFFTWKQMKPYIRQDGLLGQFVR